MAGSVFVHGSRALFEKLAGSLAEAGLTGVHFARVPELVAALRRGEPEAIVLGGLAAGPTPLGDVYRLHHALRVRTLLLVPEHASRHRERLLDAGLGDLCYERIRARQLVERLVAIARTPRILRPTVERALVVRVTTDHACVPGRTVALAPHALTALVSQPLVPREIVTLRLPVSAETTLTMPARVLSSRLANGMHLAGLLLLAMTRREQDALATLLQRASAEGTTSPGARRETSCALSPLVTLEPAGEGETAPGPEAWHTGAFPVVRPLDDDEQWRTRTDLPAVPRAPVTPPSAPEPKRRAESEPRSEPRGRELPVDDWGFFEAQAGPRSEPSQAPVTNVPRAPPRAETRRAIEEGIAEHLEASPVPVPAKPEPSVVVARADAANDDIDAAPLASEEAIAREKRELTARLETLTALERRLRTRTTPREPGNDEPTEPMERPRRGLRALLGGFRIF